ncbi:MAG TPA: PQ-loop domain-containing transporter [Candidatus Nanoarchaeia archaeon]|nr:PQ-loop domain-containing transporter [Candidatus Nanoarchaeia archaeon]
MAPGAGLHHIHRRKLKRQFPHRNPAIRLLDKALLWIAVIGPLMALPQVVKVYAEQNAAGLSLFSWTLFAVLNIPWIFYGIVHRERPILIAYCLWLLVNTAVVVGIVVYA